MGEKFDVDAELIRKLAGLLDETGLTEVEYEADDRRIRVTRQTTAVAMAPAPVVHHVVAGGHGGALSAGNEVAAHPGLVKSPMVGVAYLSPEPGSEVFVKIGDSITAGQTLLLIEAMKTFNPISAPRSGRLTNIVVGDGAPVEYGEALMIIE